MFTQENKDKEYSKDSSSSYLSKSNFLITQNTYFAKTIDDIEAIKIGHSQNVEIKYIL